MSEAAPTTDPTTSAAPAASAAADVAPPPSEAATPRGRGRSAPVAKTAETSPAETPKAEPEKPKADHWAKLTHKEKQHKKASDELAAERRAFAEERKAIEAQKERLSLLDRAKAGDWDAQQQLMKEGGLSYDQLTKRMLAAGKVDKGETALAEVERLKAELAEQRANAAKEAEEAAFSDTVETFVRHVTQEAPADYPILAGEIEVDRPWVESVLREMLAVSRESGVRITYAEAGGKLEAYLRTTTDRRVARLRPATPPMPPADEATKQSTETRPRDETGRFAGVDGPRRLTNRDSAERSTAPPLSSSRRLTAFERRQEEKETLRRAAAAMPRR